MPSNSDQITDAHCWLLDVEPALYKAKLAAIVLPFIIAASVMIAWLHPAFSTLLPDNWFKMQATTALIIMLLSTTLMLKVTPLPINTVNTQHLLITITIIIVCTIFYEHLNHQIAILGPYLVSDAQLPMVHPTSIQSASCLLLMAIILSMNEKEQGKLGYVICILIFLLLLSITAFLSSYLYGANQLIASNSYILISKQTLICIALLSIVITVLRAPYGLYAVFFHTSHGGQFARRFLTLSFLATSAVLLLETSLLMANTSNIADVNAITLTADIAILVSIIIYAANKVEKQSHLLEQLVITDKLTSVYNLRGLKLYAEQKLLDARRSQTPLFAMVFDLDGLKQVNDHLGHETGSELIKAFATTLKNNYRSNDIVARVGGDEFVVVTAGNPRDVKLTQVRLSQVINDINKTDKYPFDIHYSVGMAQLEPASTETMDDLIQKADQRMYEAKHKKKEVAGLEAMMI